jgi:hypothetical protein
MLSVALYHNDERLRLEVVRVSVAGGHRDCEQTFP